MNPLLDEEKRRMRERRRAATRTPSPPAQKYDGAALLAVLSAMVFCWPGRYDVSSTTGLVLTLGLVLSCLLAFTFGLCGFIARRRRA